MRRAKRVEAAQFRPRPVLKAARRNLGCRWLDWPVCRLSVLSHTPPFCRYCRSTSRNDPLTVESARGRKGSSLGLDVFTVVRGSGPNDDDDEEEGEGKEDGGLQLSQAASCS